MSNNLTIAFAASNAAVAASLAKVVLKEYPEVEIEMLPLRDRTTPLPKGAVVALLFDGDFDNDKERREWLDSLNNRRAMTPLLPIAVDDNHGRPPRAIAGLKSRFIRADESEILISIGSLLGITLRPGENRLFISYRSTDGKTSAERVHGHLTKLGYDAWLDEADDRFGKPNLNLGADVQAEIERRLETANGLVLIDSPDSPNSPWVWLEIETAIGKMIPIFPIVLHPPESVTEICRFRVLQNLHRRAVVESVYSGKQLEIPEIHLSAISQQVERYLCGVYRNRIVQVRELAKFFSEKKWDFNRNKHLPHLHDARTGAVNTVFSLLACCSFEDVIFCPRVRAFVEAISLLASRKSTYTRNVFLYPGSTLLDRDLEELMAREVPELQNVNTSLFSYNEAVAKISAMAGGFHA